MRTQLKLMMVVLAVALIPAAASAQPVKIGALFGVTGPIANFIPPITDGANLAVKEINDNGGILDGRKLELVIGDSGCSPQAGVDAATKLVNVNNVVGIVGPMCSGPTIAAASSVMIPTGVPTISPTATSPDLTGLEDKDYIFRVIPSDNFQGKVMGKLVLDQGLKRVALTYANNDYAVGLATAFRNTYTALGGTITADQVHEEKKSSYRSELATLSRGNPEALVLIAYAGSSGITIVKQSLENGFFERFIGPDGMRDDLLIEQIGGEYLGKSFFTTPSSVASSAKEKFEKNFAAFSEHGVDKMFIKETYDAIMVMALAIEQAGSTDRRLVRKMIRAVATADGEVIEPGEWAKAKRLIAAHQAINYNGAAGEHEFDGNGDVAGVIGHYIVEGNKYKEIDILK